MARHRHHAWRGHAEETELSRLPGVTVLSLDVTDSSEITSTIAKAVSLNAVDVVFNNAGYGMTGPLEGRTDEQIVRMVNTNLAAKRSGRQ